MEQSSAQAVGSFSNIKSPFSAVSQVSIYFIASLQGHMLGVCHIHPSAVAKGVLRIKTSPASPRLVCSPGNTHRELGSAPAVLPAMPRFGCGLCSQISLRWKIPPGSGKQKGNLPWGWSKLEVGQKKPKNLESSLGC